MPHRSGKVHNWMSILGGVFALFLIAGSFLVTRNLNVAKSPLVSSNNLLINGEGIVAESSDVESKSEAPGIDTANWKSYRDPIYHFELKYPAEWVIPVAKKINDPDFDYEYQVAFGTAETIAGSGIDGFNLYVFPTTKCSTTNPDGRVSCATKKTQSSVDSISSQKIYEFSSQVYSYTIVPFIPETGTNPSVAETISAEIDAAQKTFSIDPTLQLIPQPKPAVKTQNLPAVQAPKPAPAPRSGRSGKLTGAVSKGGKLVCPHPNRKPKKSPNKGNHVDEDCCPDPDEYPNRACAYKSSDYSIMLKP